MKSYLFIMVLLSVFTIPLIAAPTQDKTGVNSLRISILNSKEEVVKTDLYMTVFNEILAISPAEIKQKWLPSYIANYNARCNVDVKSKLKKYNILNNRGGHRISSGTH